MAFFRFMAWCGAMSLVLCPIAWGWPVPVGNAFTYQGQLKQGGSNVNATADFEFRLFDVAAGGTIIGSMAPANGVTITNGLFTVEIDFGAGVFGTDARWLDISVRSPAGSGIFTPLSPRQRLNPTPIAQFALSADGPNLTNLNANNLASGTVADTRLSGNVGMLNNAQTFSGAKTFSAAPSFTAVGGSPFSVTSTTLVTNLNADRLDGLNSTAFLQSIPVPLTLSGTSAFHIIRGENASTDNFSSGVVGLSTAASGINYGGRFESASTFTSAAGVHGLSTAATGLTYGVYGQSASSTDGRGVGGFATAATGGTFGVLGVSNSTAGFGVYGQASAASGDTYGLLGRCLSTSGRGVFGQAEATTGVTYGGQFRNYSTSGRGVSAFASATTGFTYGGHFESASQEGVSIYAINTGAGVAGHFVSSNTFGEDGYGYTLLALNTATGGDGFGIVGQSESTSGRAVVGLANAGSGTTYGVYGGSYSPSGYGVFGGSYNDTGTGTGVSGWSESASGRGVSGVANADSGAAAGVYGESPSTSGRGVWGYATAATGTTYGGRFVSDSAAGQGVLGYATAASGTTYGGRFVSNSPGGRGVHGQATAATGANIGGIFESDSTSGYGVVGQATAGSGTIYGVWGFAATSGWAVFAAGDFGASGAKAFRIDHPDDPANKYLLHYSTESPEVLNAYSGTIRLNGAGEAVVELPHYFAKINRDPRYTLTAIGAAMPNLHIAQEIDEAALIIGAMAEPAQPAPACWFRIAGGAPGMKVSWRVEALRNDKWVQQRGAPVEVEKQGFEKGTYQHPELYGQPPEKGMNYDAERGGRAERGGGPAVSDAAPR